MNNQLFQGKWKRLQTVVSSLNNEVLAKGDARESQSAYKEKMDNYYLHWVEQLIAFSEEADDIFPNSNRFSDSDKNPVITSTSGVCIGDKLELLLHDPLDQGSSSILPPATEFSFGALCTKIRTLESWEKWTDGVMNHFTPNPPPSFCNHIKQQQRNSLYNNTCGTTTAYDIKTFYERHSYEQQIASLHRHSQQFQTAWSRNEFSLVQSILIRAVAQLSSVTDTMDDLQQVSKVSAASSKEIFRRWYPVTFVYATKMLDDFRSKILQRIQSYSSMINSSNSIGKTSFTYPLCYPNSNEILLQSYGDEFRVDCSIARSNDCRSSSEIYHDWLFKIRSIYELLPRLYMETALIQSWIFISSLSLEKDIVPPIEPCNEICIFRLSSMLRGIGDPVVMIYMQCYVIHTYCCCYLSTLDNEKGAGVVFGNNRKSNISTHSISQDDVLSLIMDFLCHFFSILLEDGRTSQAPSLKNERVKDILQVCFPAIGRLFQVLISCASKALLFSNNAMTENLMKSFDLYH